VTGGHHEPLAIPQLSPSIIAPLKPTLGTRRGFRRDISPPALRRGRTISRWLQSGAALSGRLKRTVVIPIAGATYEPEIGLEQGAPSRTAYLGFQA
jgi:hypothetical protein